MPRGIDKQRTELSLHCEPTQESLDKLKTQEGLSTYHGWSVDDKTGAKVRIEHLSYPAIWHKRNAQPPPHQCSYYSSFAVIMSTTMSTTITTEVKVEEIMARKSRPKKRLWRD